MKHAKVLLLFVSIAMIMSCNTNKKVKREKPMVLSTTGMINDAVINLLGEHVEAVMLMGPGVDPHYYKATQGDLKKMNQSDVIVFNGLFLEGKLTDILEKLGRKKNVYNFSSVVSTDQLLPMQSEGVDEIDPHIWFDVELWSSCISGLADYLIGKYPIWKDEIEENQKTYLASIEEVYENLKGGLDSIKEESKLLITSHDAFQYFGRSFGVGVNALQGISTAAEFGVQDRKALVDLIISKKVKAIFIESSVSSKPLEAIIEDCKQKGHDVKIGGELFSDAMGAFGTEEGTYIGMIKHNVQTIASGLK